MCRIRRANTQSSGPISLPSAAVLVVLVGGIFAAWGYQVIQPSPAKVCGSPGGPAVTAQRIKLRDGRHLAYQEGGVSRDGAKIRIVFVHGLDVCRLDDVIAANASPELVEELGIYFVSYDRPGYGESDPHPSRTVKTQVSDIEELADQLGLGPKFYLIGYSLGGQLSWGCLKYIPHRLAGVSLLTPAVNYWWPGFPTQLSNQALYESAPCDYWSLRVAHHAPWLTHWWNTQKWFSSFGAFSRSPHVFSREDMEIRSKKEESGNMTHTRQQGEYESIHRDLNIAVGTWEFDPLDMQKNPFLLPNNNEEASVHLWQGDEDKLVPVTLQRYIADRLSWVRYHELPGSGHAFPHQDGMADTILKTMLLTGKQ